MSAEKTNPSLEKFRNHHNRSYELDALQSSDEERSISNLLLSIRNVCSQIKGYAEIIETNLPNIHSDMMKSSNLPTSSSLVVGIRHFILGVKQIANSMETILSDADIAENKELSLASFGVLSNIERSFQTMRSFVGNIFLTYNYYIPEILLTKCMYDYMLKAYPERSFYELPFQLVRDILAYFNANTDIPITYSSPSQGFKSIPTPRMQKFEEINKLQKSRNDYNDIENEIRDKPSDGYIQNEIQPHFPESTNSAESSLNISIFNLDNLKKRLHLKKPPIKIKFGHSAWKKCFKMYTLESLVRLVEEYLIQR